MIVSVKLTITVIASFTFTFTNTHSLTVCLSIFVDSYCPYVDNNMLVSHGVASGTGIFTGKENNNLCSFYLV